MNTLRSSVVGLLLCLVASAASGQVPDLVSFQGQLSDSGSGEVADTVIDIRTRIYQDGGLVFDQTHADVVVSGGVFNLALGPLTGIAFDRPTELGVTVGASAPEILPRTSFLSAPYSLGLRLPFHVDTTGEHGIYVEFAAEDGIRVDQAFDYAANLRSAKNGASTIANHIVRIENTSVTTSLGPDILALKSPAASPNTGSNFITFFNSSNASRGSIEGNGVGVQLGSAGSDYAEFLPHAAGAHTFEAGDVVGVVGGHISRKTADSDRVMAITDQAIVVGNSPGEDEAREGFETVSFIGQLPIRVIGPATAGDFLVASGRADGTAVAVHPDQITIAQARSLVGQVWEDSPDTGLRRVNTAVGLGDTAVLLAIIEQQQRQIDQLRALIHAKLGS